MKIAFFELEDWERAELEKGPLEGHELLLSTLPLNERTLAERNDADIVSVFVHSALNRTTIDKLPNLKFIATRSTGFDHIDLEACRERGIQVSTVPS